MRVLIVMSGASQLSLRNGQKVPTGSYAEEFVRPYDAVKAAGIEVDIATPDGVLPPFDPRTVDRDPHFREVVDTAPELKRPLTLEQIGQSDLARYDAVFVPGGNAPMEDLSKSRAMGQLLEWAHDSQLIVATLCHGSAALLPALGHSGEWLFKGYKMTGYSAEEEAQGSVAGLLPFELEGALKQKGADYHKVDPRKPLVVVDRDLITGQNPASAAALGDALVHRLMES